MRKINREFSEKLVHITMWLAIVTFTIAVLSSCSTQHYGCKPSNRKTVATASCYKWSNQ